MNATNTNTTETVQRIIQNQEKAFEREFSYLKLSCPEIPEGRLRSIATLAFYAGVKAMIMNPIE